LKQRSAILADLGVLPHAKVATHAEVMKLVDDWRLWRRGLGWIDMHLLASARLSHCRLWTLDRKLAEAASELGV
jgi:hypothetical protein